MEDTFDSTWERVYLLAHEVYPVARSTVADHLCTEEAQLHCSWCMWSSNFSEKTSWCFNHRVITLIANKLERQLLWEGYFGMEDYVCKAIWEGAAQFILQPHCTENPQHLRESLQNALQSCSKELCCSWCKQVGSLMYSGCQCVVVVIRTGQLPLRYESLTMTISLACLQSG